MEKTWSSVVIIIVIKTKTMIKDNFYLSDKILIVFDFDAIAPTI